MSDNNQEVVNLDDLSLDEIRELAQKEEAGQDIAPTTEKKPTRDEKGRFTKAEEAEVEETEDEPEKTVFRREIDLGDGSGVQVFQADSLEELVDKLAEAQKNATKKIREQADRLKKIETEKAKVAAEEKQLTEDEEFVLAQELMSNPSQAIKKAFKQITGYDITEFKTVAERAQAWEAAQTQQMELQKQNDAATGFINAHPEYVANATNGARLQKALNLMIAETKNQGQEVDYPTLLEQAYRDLSESGLLELKSKDDVTTEDEPSGAAQRRIVETEEVVQPQRKKASGLGRQFSRTAPVRNTEPSIDDLYDESKYSLDQLRELANRSR